MIINLPRIDVASCDTEKPDRVIVKPGVVTLCNAGEVLLQAFHAAHGTETLLDADVTWSSSDDDIATVDGDGNVVAVSAGEAFITANWKDQIGFCKVTCSIEESCCGNVNVGTLLMIDNSRSMVGAFNIAYPTLLDAAKHIADRFSAGLDITKDLMGLVKFSAAQEVLQSLTTSFLSEEISNISAVSGRDITDIRGALSFGISSINQCVSCQRKVLVFFSDGNNQPEMGTADYYATIGMARAFKESGGIIICVGLRASGVGYLLLQAMATSGFFLNVWGEGVDPIMVATETLLGLRGYFCADYYQGGYIPSTPPPAQTPDGGYGNLDVVP